MDAAFLAAIRVAASLPDLGDPAVIAFGGTLGGFAGGMYGLLAGARDPERLYWVTFVGGMWGTGVTLCLYLIGLVSDLY